MNLQPPPTIQKELYKLYSVLVQVVQLAPSDFSVVDPHDFIEVLSWSDVVGAGDAQAIRRLRDQVTTPNGVRRRLFIPFSLDADVFLAVVGLGGADLQILDQRTEEDLRSREKDDGFETSTFVWEFIHTLFPDECPIMARWNILFQNTVQSPVAIIEPEIVSGRYVDEFERHLQLGSIIPFLFEALQLLCGVRMQKKVTDVALLKRLLALFEGSSCLKTTNIIESLRRKSRDMLSALLEGRIRAILTLADIDFRRQVASTRLDSGGHCSPTELLYLKFDCKFHASNVVRESRNAAADLMAQYGQIRTLLEGMVSRCLMTKISLHHAMVNDMAVGWFYCINGQREIWQPRAALNQYRSQGLNVLAERVQDMKEELDHWLGILNEHLDSSRMR